MNPIMLHENLGRGVLIGSIPAAQVKDCVHIWNETFQSSPSNRGAALPAA